MSAILGLNRICDDSFKKFFEFALESYLKGDWAISKKLFE